MKIIELLGKDGTIPPAWYSLYAWTALVKSAALFGDGKIEEGYDTLDIALQYSEKLSQLNKGDLLDTGNKEILSGVKYEFSNDVIVLPDGSKEPISYDYRMNFNAETLVYCLTARSGWEWFNPVRNENRFKEYIERAKKITNK